MGSHYGLGARVRGLVTLFIAGAVGLCAPAFAQQPAPATPEASAIESGYAAYARGDLVEAAREFTRLAQGGNRLAQFNLAVMHANNEVPDASTQTALLLLRVAAERGLTQAMYALGESYETGTLTPKDLAASAQWYRRAADAGHDAAAVAIATAYYLGRGVAHDDALAARYFLQAANAGDVGAQYIYASMCETGTGIARDRRLAQYWYAIAARNGDIGAAIKARELGDE